MRGNREESCCLIYLTRENALRFFLVFIALPVLSVLFTLHFTDRLADWNVPRSVLLILGLLLLAGLIWPGLPCRLFVGPQYLNFRDRKYYENYPSRLATFIRAMEKVGAPLIVVFCLICAADFEVAKGLRCAELQSRCSVENSAATCEKRGCPEFYARDYVVVRANLLGSFMLGLFASIVTAYWNLDSIHGRKWSYLCGLYNDLVKAQAGTLVRENIRISLCIDIVDHGMWNTKQFKVFFVEEIGKYRRWVASDSGVEEEVLRLISDVSSRRAVKDGLLANIGDANLGTSARSVRSFLSAISAYIDKCNGGYCPSPMSNIDFYA